MKSMIKRTAMTLGLFLLAAPAWAKITVPGADLPLEDPLQGKSLETLIGNVIDWMIKIAAPILVIMILWGAFYMLTAGDNENRVTQGKKTIQYAVIGFAIILMARGLIEVIKQFLGVTK
jgi:Type IV secretion system pilin